MKNPRHWMYETLEPRYALNAAPTPMADVAIVAEGSEVALSSLLANDTDPDGDALTLLNASTPEHGSLRRGTGGLIYTAPAGFTGVDTFEYTVSDGSLTATTSVTIPINATIDAAATRSELLAGVTQLSDPGSPGRMVAYGPTAVDVAYYPGGASDGPMIAAATWGDGRVVALPDHQWLNMNGEAGEGTMGQFYSNSIAWLTGTSSKSIKIVVLNNSSSVSASWLNSQGYTNVVTSNDLAGQLGNADVLIGWLTPTLSQTNADAIANFARGGGGFFVAGYGQGYQGHNNWWAGQVHESPANRLLREAGIGFASGSQNGTGLSITAATTSYNAETILAIFSDLGSYSAAEKSAAANQLARIIEVLPPGDNLSAQMIAAINSVKNSINPTPATPVTGSFEKAVLATEMTLIQDLPPDQVTAHRTAEAVYGAIPPAAHRVADEVVSIATDKTGWLSTGLYAAPGEIVTIEFPPSLVGQGYHIQISGHVDNISSRSSWNRVPFGVDRRFEINSTSVQVASAFGGAIYIDVGDLSAGTPPSSSPTNITISGAIRAPHFVLGVTTNDEWISTIRDFPAPYAELVSNGLAMSVPSSWIRDLDDPTALMTYWQEVVDRLNYVGGYESLRTGPERFNVDVQISAGLLHAGYPIQGPTTASASQELVDLVELKEDGNWGYFHELGHEMQRNRVLGWNNENPYTFSGDVEVTVNIFANAALEQQVVAPSGDFWHYSVYPGQVMARARTTIFDAAAPDFDDKDPYPFYYQLADGFGWDTYREVLGGYVEDQLNNPAAIPQTNGQKKDQWLIRWSTATGFDLTNYMVDRWGLEVSQSALNQVAALNLPDWLPATTTVEHFEIVSNETRTFNLASTGTSLTGGATFVSAGAPTSGTLADNSDGTFTYSPPLAFTGVDEIPVVYQSSAGNQMTTIIKVQVTAAAPLTPGDYDGSGIVDEVDYIVWRSQFGRTGNDLPADGNGDGRVDAADYTVWRDNLGNVASAVSFVQDSTASLLLVDETTATNDDDNSIGLAANLVPRRASLASINDTTSKGSRRDDSQLNITDHFVHGNAQALLLFLADNTLTRDENLDLTLLADRSPESPSAIDAVFSDKDFAPATSAEVDPRLHAWLF